MSRYARGQTLVLFSLTLLLLVLMVTLTLSMGMRVKENHELQHLADAAAYSNAVATARVYNNVSLLNRIQVSYWVAMAADQSLISWTSMARAYGGAAQNAYGVIIAANIGPCAAPSPCNCATIAAATSLIAQINNNLGTRLMAQGEADWESMDQRAGAESQAIQGIIGGLRDESRQLSIDLRSKLDAQHYVNEVIRRARPGMPGGGELASRSHGISGREAGGQVAAGGAPGQYGIVGNLAWNMHMLDAAMGSRLHPFVSGRIQVPSFTSSKVFNGLSGGQVRAIPTGGSGYWGEGHHQFGETHAEHAWADDHGTVLSRVTAPGTCGLRTFPWRASAHVKSTHIDDQADEHVWSRGAEPGTPAREDHTMGTCQPFCPSVWVRAMAFAPTNPAADAYGQPKNYAVVERDYARRPKDPWHLDFRFRFSPGGNERFENSGQRLSAANGGINISKAGALGTGMVYYHRKGYWQEFPNMLNPFWRATLVAADIDAQSTADIPAVLEGWQGDVFLELDRVDFKGLH
jgi:hypothetical protein